MEIYDRVEDVVGYRKEDVDEIIYNLMYFCEKFMKEEGITENEKRYIKDLENRL